MELSHTAYVVLGMLRHGPRSGYEIKAVVDKSTRFFWAASYGQIYPELKRLADAGLIEGRGEASGGRKRTVYTLTDAGRAKLADWLSRGAEVLEYRDEGLLKLFFAAADPDAALAILEAKQRLHEEKLAALRTVEAATLEIKAAGDPFPDLVLRYGIESTEWMVAWCKRARAEVEKGAS